MLRADRTGGSGAVRFGNGTSDSGGKYCSIERAREIMGYEPMDNSAERDGAGKTD